MMTTNITTVINYLKLQTTCAKKLDTKYIAKHHPTTFFYVSSIARQRKNLGFTVGGCVRSGGSNKYEMIICKY